MPPISVYNAPRRFLYRNLSEKGNDFIIFTAVTVSQQLNFGLAMVDQRG
jgi:hypothetical protein